VKHRALPIAADWPTRCADGTTFYAPQGRPEQGWKVGNTKGFRRVPDRLPEAYDVDDGEPLTLREALRFWAVTCAPAAFMGLVFVLAVWGFKP
jgi:hypothetical protein